MCEYLAPGYEPIPGPDYYPCKLKGIYWVQWLNKGSIVCHRHLARTVNKAWDAVYEHRLTNPYTRTGAVRVRKQIPYTTEIIFGKECKVGGGWI